MADECGHVWRRYLVTLTVQERLGRLPLFTTPTPALCLLASASPWAVRNASLVTQFLKCPRINGCPCVPLSCTATERIAPRQQCDLALLLSPSFAFQDPRFQTATLLYAHRLVQRPIHRVPTLHNPRARSITRTVPAKSAILAMSGPVAVVTGACGFVGSELVKQLLTAGWSVRGTVRGSTDAARVANLKAVLPSEHLNALTLHSADLLEPGVFDEVVKGAQYVFHVASPFQVAVPNPESDLLRPALEGTRNVMTAVIKSKDTIKRVVLTSSVAAVHDCFCKQPPSRGELYSEDDFNTTSTPEAEPYWVSKVSAEQEAWSLAKAHGIDLVTILPEFVMGPVLTLEAAQASLSSEFFKGFLASPGEGVKAPSGTWIFSDVREVAAAHILAATTPAASGRYIVACSESLDAQAVSKILKSHFPTLDIVEGEAADTKYNLDNSKAPRELGLKLRPAASTLVDMAHAMIDVQLVKPRAKEQ